MASIKAEQLAEAVNKALKEYADLAADDLKVVSKDVAKEVKKQIKNNAPKETGKYSKGWTSKVVAQDSHSITISVYQSKRWMLTHLLENGHAKRNGGRVRAIPHIEPAEEAGNEKFIYEITKKLESH